MKQIVSLSGGKDSTAMLLMMLERGEQIDDIVFFDWGMEFPAIYEHLEKLERYIGRHIARLHPPFSWDYYMVSIVKIRGPQVGQQGYGWPNPRSKLWCSARKLRALQRYAKGAISCIGYSYEERHRRPLWKDSQRYPLLEWGVAEAEALKFCLRHGFDFGSLYNLSPRLGCWCCPLQGTGSLRSLRDNFPDLWQRLLNMDARSPYPWPNDNLEKVRI